MNVWNEFVKRVLKEHSNQILGKIVSSDDIYDTYEISGRDGEIHIKGNTLNALTCALGDYLRTELNADLSWCGARMDLPEILPAPTTRRRVIEQRYRAYMNYCTFNYSASWWDFERWEKEIDFMALNGINMPLCVVGIEGVWYHVLTERGFSKEEVLNYFAGPAFLAWQWMGNIESFAGPLPENWIEMRTELGQRIINRVVELGMMPIQQGFSGNIPNLFMEKYPDANIKLKEMWFGMASTAQLDPTDKLFVEIGTEFLNKQKEIFGAYGFYASDPFHESEPPVEGEEYLVNVAKTIADMFYEFDKNYKWMMQSWSIRKEIACAVPKDRLLILDLNGIRYSANDNFWGYEFVLGNLHNFGGRTKLHGDLYALSENKYLKAKEEGANIVGTGLFMEGINQNPVYYSLAFEMLTSVEKKDIHNWLEIYAKRRYGKSSSQTQKAWEILLDTVYTHNTDGVEKSSAVCARPAFDLKKSGPNDGFEFNYDIKRIAEAAKLLLECDFESEGYYYDLVDITRQYLSDFAYFLHKDIKGAFENGDKTKFDADTKRFITLLDDIDLLLGTRKEFSFEEWISSARNFGKTEAEKALYEYNATALVTIWGTDEEPHIFDYAWREWSGLISQYYKMRWKFFFAEMSQKLENGEKYSEEGLPQVFDREAWRANEMYCKMADLEVEWIHSEKVFKKVENLDCKRLVKELLKKYAG